MPTAEPTSLASDQTRSGRFSRSTPGMSTAVAKLSTTAPGLAQLATCSSTDGTAEAGTTTAMTSPSAARSIFVVHGQPYSSPTCRVLSASCPITKQSRPACRSKSCPSCPGPMSTNSILRSFLHLLDHTFCFARLCQCSYLYLTAPVSCCKPPVWNTGKQTRTAFRDMPTNGRNSEQICIEFQNMVIFMFIIYKNSGAEHSFVLSLFLI